LISRKKDSGSSNVGFTSSRVRTIFPRSQRTYMRKSGPLRSIRLCAYTAVGADSGEFRVLSVADKPDVASEGEVSEAKGWMETFDGRKYQTNNVSKTTRAEMISARRRCIDGPFLERLSFCIPTTMCTNNEDAVSTSPNRA
jgi:hypothetical protein